MSNQGEPWPINDPTKKMIHAYEMGLDCGRNGPNQENCDHRIFSEEFYTLAWDLGFRLGQVSEFSLLIAYVAATGMLITEQASLLIQATTIITFVVSSYIVVLNYPTPIAISDQLRRD